MSETLPGISLEGGDASTQAGRPELYILFTTVCKLLKEGTLTARNSQLTAQLMP